MLPEPVVVAHARAGLPSTAIRPLRLTAVTAPCTPLSRIALDPVATSTSPPPSNDALTAPLIVRACRLPPRPRAVKALLLVATFRGPRVPSTSTAPEPCLLYTSDAADERSSVDLG